MLQQKRCNFSGSTRDRMYLKARAGRAAWKRSFEGTIYAHIEYLGIRLLASSRRWKERGVPPRATSAPLWRTRIALRFEPLHAAKKERARVAIRLQNRPGGRNNPPVRSSTDRHGAICVWQPRKKLRLNLSANSGGLSRRFYSRPSQIDLLLCHDLLLYVSLKFAIITK